MYLDFLRREIKKKQKRGEPLGDVQELPDGLAGEYKKQMKKILVDRLPEGISREAVLERVIGTIIAALRPLHWRDELPQLSGVSVEDVEQILMETELSQLFVVHNDERVYVFHKSIVDWLTRAPPYNQRRHRHDFAVESPRIELLRRHGLLFNAELATDDDWARAMDAVRALPTYWFDHIRSHLQHPEIENGGWNEEWRARVEVEAYYGFTNLNVPTADRLGLGNDRDRGWLSDLKQIVQRQQPACLLYTSPSPRD